MMSKKISQFESQRVFTPDEIEAIINKNDPLLHHLFELNPNSQKLIARSILITGEIVNQNPLKSLHRISSSSSEPSESLVVRVNFDSPKYAEIDDYSEISSLRLTKNFFFDQLHEGENIQTRVQPRIKIQRNNVTCNTVVYKESIKHIDRSCYNHASTVSSTKSLNLLQRLWNPIGLAISFLPSIFGFHLEHALCFALRVDSREIGVRNGSLAMFLGDVVYDIQKGEMTMDNPIRMMRSKIEALSEMKNLFQSYKSDVFWSIVGTSIFFLLGGSMLVLSLRDRNHLVVFGKPITLPGFIVRPAHKIVEHFTKQHFILHDANAAKEKYIDVTYENPREGIQCIICYENSRSIILRPCLHCSICSSCFNSLKKWECPVCKAQIIGAVPIALKQ